MRILHTADWHLGKKLDFFSRLEEQKEVLEEICVLADEQEVDLVVVSGDLFDTFNPSVEATELLYKTLKKLTNQGKRPVIALAGNHDSPDRIDSADPLARECGIFFFGYPNMVTKTICVENSFEVTRADKGFIEIKIPKYDYPIRILCTPFANEIRLKQYLEVEDKSAQLQDILQENWQTLADQYCDHNGVNILASHLYMLKKDGPVLEEPEGEKPIRLGYADLIYSSIIPSTIQYTALGHLHRFHDIGQNNAPVVYPSSPLCYSFSEAGQQKQIVIVDLTPNQPATYSAVALHKGRRLHRVKFSAVDDAVLWLQQNPNTLVELTLESSHFLTANDMRSIHQAHDGIIYIIPKIITEKNDNQITEQINLEQDMKDLFIDFFKSKHGQAPNSDLLSLFDEVAKNSMDKED